LAASENDDDRSDAAWLLGFVHHHITSDVLIRLSSDKSPDVRQSACGSLSSFKGDAQVFDALSRCLTDSDEQVRISAVSSLGYFGDQRALPLLLPLQRWASLRLHHILVFAIEQLQK
jgi:HEAT repeat protein